MEDSFLRDTLWEQQVFQLILSTVCFILAFAAHLTDRLKRDAANCDGVVQFPSRKNVFSVSIKHVGRVFN